MKKKTTISFVIGINKERIYMRKILLKLLGYDSDITFLQTKLIELDQFIDDNCSMQDRNGSTVNYISEDVAQKWTIYRNITNDMSIKLMKLRG